VRVARLGENNRALPYSHMHTRKVIPNNISTISRQPQQRANIKNMI